MRKCCFCNCDLKGIEGNNPWPIIDDETSECCTKCNDEYVIPARKGTLPKELTIKETSGTIYFSLVNNRYQFKTN